MGKMTPGFKFFNVVGATAVVFLSFSLFGISVTRAETDGLTFRIRTLGVVGIIFGFNEGNYLANAYPPQMFQRRLGAPMPEFGRPPFMEDEDSEEDDEEGVESGPRLEPHITPLNRDQCLAKLLCGMSVPVTGGNSKKNYYSEYANIVSKFFEAFPLDDEIQSKESMESYDDYSNEDDDKPTRTNSKRKPLNSSRVEATTSQPPLQLFELALVDVAKPEDLRAQNRTKKEAIQKVSRGNRMARARKIVENLGQKLQTVRQCQSINGCPFSFKQLRETLKKKEAERVSSKVPLPGPIWPPSSKRKEQPAPASFKPKPYINPESRPKPGSFAAELFSQESEKEPAFPHRDTNKGDDELEEIFGPPKVSKRPLGFHQGVDENFNYEYNSEKPWRPGQSGGNSYNQRPWQARPRPKPFDGPGPGGNGQHQQRPPPRPRPQNGPPGNQKRPRPPPPRPSQQQKRRKPGGSPLAPVVVQQSPKRPNPPAQVTTTKKPSPFPKRKISYLNSPYKKPSSSGEDDEGTEDINKVAPIEFVGNSDAGEYEPPKKTTTTTEEPEGLTEAPTTSGKKKNKNNEDSDEYDEDEDDYYDDEYDVQEEEDEEDEEDYSDEDEEDEEDKKLQNKKEKKRKRKKQKNKKNKNKKKKGEDKKEVETVVDDEPVVVTPKTKMAGNKYYDDENEGLDEIWTKLNFATTGANYKPPAKLKKKEKYKVSSGESDETESEAVGVTSNNQKNDDRDDDDDGDDDDDDDEEDDIDEEEEGLKGSLTSMQKVRASSSSASNEDDADDEVDDENQSKRKKSSKTRLEARPVERDETYDEERLTAPSESNNNGNSKTKKRTNKKSSKNKKKKTADPSSNEENEEEEVKERPKNIMMEIGGRPLVPKPDHNEKANAHKTSSLIPNRFKFQFINPYGPAPPQGAASPMDLPGGYPLRASHGHDSEDSPPHANLGNQGSGSSSGLPFKFKLNPGPLGNLAGGPGGPNLISLGGFGGHGPPSSMEMPDPHHPPPPTPFMPQNHGPNPFSRNDAPQQHYSQPSGFSGSGMGSSLFKLNPIPALSKLFKKPSHDSMHDGHSAPPVNSFIHRPIGPESSSYRRDKLSPASGSSNPVKNKGSKGSSTKKSKGKGKKEKSKQL